MASTDVVDIAERNIMYSLTCKETDELKKGSSEECCDLTSSEGHTEGRDEIVCEETPVNEYQRSNNATTTPCPDSVIKEENEVLRKVEEVQEPTEKYVGIIFDDNPNIEKDTETKTLQGQVNMAFESDSVSEDGFCIVNKSSDDNVELQEAHQDQVQQQEDSSDHLPTVVSAVEADMQMSENTIVDNNSAVNADQFGKQTKMAYAGSSCTESPGISSQDGASFDDEESIDYSESAADERIASIEEEYIQRIAALEQRHYELEDVLARLTASLEDGLCESESSPDAGIPNETAQEGPRDQETENEGVGDTNDVKRDAETMEKKKCSFTRKMGIDLFVEFQQKIRNFAADLNGVLNCSEAAIRHARVVQEWATSVQLMFEQIKDERQKILNYIDERERNMLIAKEQFIAELREQGAQLKQLVEEMKTYRELRDNGEKYCKTKVDDGSQRKSLDETIIDVLLRKRLEEDRSIILSLSKQSKISEMKLFIIHQQSCIQQLQEQNNELKAIIEGLMGPDELEVCEPPTKQQGSSGLTPLLSPLSTPDLQMKEEEEICDTDQSGTPASVSTPDRCPVRDTLDRIEDPSLSLVSDVLHCDRGEYLPGTSTDGDVATVQAYAIGNHSDRIDGGDKVVFDPLTVPYVREQCQLAEESERRAHAASNIEVEDVSKVQLSAESDIQMLQNGVEALNMEPYLRKCSEEERIYEAITEDHEAAGDGVDVTSQKISLESPEKTSESEIPPENVGIESNLPPVGVIADIPPPISPL